MDSILRDINREHEKMKNDTAIFHSHYEKMVAHVREYIKQTTIEWARLVVSHPKTVILIVETTRILDEDGFSSWNESEPIRFTYLPLASGEMWDQLIQPTHSRQVVGTEYHGLTIKDLEGKPTISQIWPSIYDALQDRQIVIFGADWAKKAIGKDELDSAYCLHNKAKEYYGEFYELSLESILAYQGINKKREELKDSRERILMLQHVLKNLAAGMEKQEPVPEPEGEDLSDHPF